MKTVTKITVSALVPLLGIEAGLRSIGGFGNPALLENDPDMGYLFRAEQNVHRLGRTIKINRFHQCSDEAAPLPICRRFCHVRRRPF